MAFPQTPIELLAEMQIGGVWTDITADLYARAPLTIERGRRDEAARVDAGTATFQLNNRANLYSPRNPRSANYGLIGRNTPVRFSVAGTESYLALDGDDANTAASTDHASFTVTDLDVRAEITADWFAEGLNQTIIGQWGSDGNRGWTWRILSGRSYLTWTTSGSTVTQISGSVAMPALPRRTALRMTLDVNNGAGGWTVSLYQADDLASAWTLVGTSTGTGVTSVYDSGAPLRIGPAQSDVVPPRHPFAGRGHRFELRASIGGSVVASPDFRAKTPGTTSFADGAGRTWGVFGAAVISDREYRLHAEVSSWPTRWDPSGRDVYVPVEASGILRRLGQGAKALSSPLRRRIPKVGSPKAYWPLEEGRDSVQAYSPLPGVAPLAVTGVEFAADDTLSGSMALPRLSAAATMAGSVPAHSSTGQWMLACVFFWETTPASSTRMITFTTTGTARTIIVNVDSGSVLMEGYSASGSTVFSIPTITAGSGFHGAWSRLELTAETSGGNVTYRIGWVDVSGAGYGATSTVAATSGTITSINTAFDPLAEGVSIGHLGVFSSSATTVYDRADDGWLGETASARLVRLGTEEDVPLVASVASTPMGPQHADTLLALLGECEASDGGVLYEDRASVELRYRSRQSYYNQPVVLTLDYSVAGHIAPPLEPTDDDQRTRNDRTVSRTGGSSARAIAETGTMSVLAPPDGIGVYDDAVTLSVATDSQLEAIAGWRLHMGTWDEARYPSVHIDLAAAPSLIPDVLGLDIGDRIQIINPPTWLPPGPIDLIVEGYSEVIGHPNSWDVVLNCSPAGPWTVAVTDDVVLGRADTAGAELASGATSTATSLSVATTAGPLWTTAAGDRPFTIRVGGEVMTVTNITGASSPQTFTVTRSVNGIVKSQLSGADVRLATPSIVAL